MRTFNGFEVKVIMSNRVARMIINNGTFTENLVDIQPNKDGSGRSVFVFKTDDDFNKYILNEFGIK